MFVKFLSTAVSYGLGYQENEIVELDDKKPIKVQVLTTLLGKDGEAKGYKYTEQEYKISDLIEKGVCKESKPDEEKEYKAAKAAHDEKVKNKLAVADQFYFIYQA